MPSIDAISKNFSKLNDEAKKAVNTMIEMMMPIAGVQEVVRRKKRGLENASSGEREDDEIAPKGLRNNNDNDKTESRGRGRPRKVVEEVTEKRGRGRPAKVVEETAPKRGRPAKEDKVVTGGTVKTAPAVNGSVYDALILKGKKDERKAELATHIKRIEKFVQNDMTWQEAKAFAEKKKVTISFGRGKPSNDLNKRKIAIAMINAGIRV